ncbi:hypothetical protein KCU84_g17993, partial [Aureobasidium melanogenum]
MTTSTESQPMLSFPDASTLDLIIPNSSDFDLESHLKSDNQHVSRDALFFEELLPVYLILRSSLPSFQEVIKNVELYITAYATQPSPPPRLQSGGAPTPPQQPLKLALDSVTITPEHKPILTTQLTECFEPTLSPILSDPQGGPSGRPHDPRSSSTQDIIEALQCLSSFGDQSPHYP